MRSSLNYIESLNLEFETDTFDMLKDRMIRFENLYSNFNELKDHGDIIISRIELLYSDMLGFNDDPGVRRIDIIKAGGLAYERKIQLKSELRKALKSLEEWESDSIRYLELLHKIILELNQSLRTLTIEARFP